MTYSCDWKSTIPFTRGWETSIEDFDEDDDEECQ